MPFSYTRTVRFGDTDAAGVVYFANVASLFHEAYEAALIEAGVDLKSFFRGDQLAVPIVHASVDFHRPMYCGDRLTIQISPQITADHEFEIRYEIFVEGQKRSVAKGLTRHVCIDAKTRLRVTIPSMLRTWIQSEFFDY